MTDAAPKKPDGEPASNGARSRKQGPTRIDAVNAKVEGIESVLNNAFQASGAALLLAIVALGLAIFLLFRVRGLAPKAVRP